MDPLERRLSGLMTDLQQACCIQSQATTTAPHTIPTHPTNALIDRQQAMWSAAARRMALLRQRPPLAGGMIQGASASASAARTAGAAGAGLQADGARRHQSGGVYNFPPSAHYDLVSAKELCGLC